MRLFRGRHVRRGNTITTTCRRAAALAAGLLVCVSALHSAAVGRATDQWHFQVSLDDKVIGSQFFELQHDGPVTRLRTEADFAVKILFATVYRYAHMNQEVWQDNCLVSVNASTEANRKSTAVIGERRDGFFTVASGGQTQRLPECVMSFAYWNPTFLEQPRVLNTQDGSYVPIDVSQPEADTLVVDGQSVPARRYKLTARNMELLLWYSLDDRWLGLQSKVRGGKILRYDLL